MKIYFERSGGFAGIRMSAFIDTMLLDRDEANKLQTIIENSLFFDLPTKTVEPKFGADYFRYKITIETQDKKHSIEVTDMTISPAIKPLIDILIDKAREGK